MAVAHQRVARQADDVDFLALRVKAHEHIRVAAAGVVVHAVDQDRVAVFFALLAIRDRFDGVSVLVLRAVLFGLHALLAGVRFGRAHDILDRCHGGHGQEKQRQKRDDHALAAAAGSFLFALFPVLAAGAAGGIVIAALIIFLISHRIAPFSLLVYNNALLAFYPVRQNCARVFLRCIDAFFPIRRKMSKKVSESFVLFPRGQTAANVALGLVDLQHLFDLKVKAAVELRQAVL